MMTDRWKRPFTGRGELLALTLLTAVGTAACGNLTAGGFGEVTVDVSGDRPEPAPSPAAAPPRMATVAPQAALLEPELISTDVEGEVQADFMVFLIAETGGALRLGDDMIEVRVDLRGRDEGRAVDPQLVPTGRYVELQIVFTDIRAEVEGLIVGGVLVPEVHVELDDTSLLVARPIDLDVRGGDSVDLLIDLNATAWIEAVDPIAGTVDEAVFASLVDVVVR